jgi:hypothetical protein
VNGTDRVIEVNNRIDRSNEFKGVIGTTVEVEFGWKVGFRIDSGNSERERERESGGGAGVDSGSMIIGGTFF